MATLKSADIGTKPTTEAQRTQRRTEESERDVAVFLGWVLVALGLEHLERIDELFAGLARLDDGVDVAALGGDIRIGELVLELFDEFRARLFFVFGFIQLALVDDVYRALGAHDGDF